MSSGPICKLKGAPCPDCSNRSLFNSVTKGNSSLREDPGIQMDASTRAFRKSVTLRSSRPRIQAKEASKPNILLTRTGLGAS